MEPFNTPANNDSGTDETSSTDTESATPSPSEIYNVPSGFAGVVDRALDRDRDRENSASGSKIVEARR